MPPQAGSRYAACIAVRDEQGRLVLTERTPLAYRALADNRVHVVVQGDTLWHLAGRYFAPLPRACGYWWLLGEFQPEPIVDPTVALDVGRTLFVPSIATLERARAGAPRAGGPA
jgi:hypothetical protein